MASRSAVASPSIDRHTASEEAKSMVRCPSCGTENQDGFEFCESCGAELTAPASQPAAPPASPAAAAPSPAPAGPPPVPAPAVSAPAKLVVKRHGAITGEEFPLGGRAVIGRFDPNLGPVDIDLAGSPEASTISRRHAEIYQDPSGQWFIRDMGSTNGVFIRRATATDYAPRITEPQPLGDGDEVAMGNAKFVFKTAG